MSDAKPGVQEKLTRYRRECFRVLWQAFRPDIVRADDLAPKPGVSGAQLAFEIATAVQHLAKRKGQRSSMAMTLTHCTAAFIVTFDCLKEIV